MTTETDLYHLLGQWVQEAKTAAKGRLEELRDTFAEGEIEIFGDVDTRTSSPVAMAYNKVRNRLVDYSGNKDPEDLALAQQEFLLLTRHYYLL